LAEGINAGGRGGFLYTGQTIYDSAFAARSWLSFSNARAAEDRYEYKLLATTRTSTTHKELNEAGRAGFVFCGMTVAETAFRRREVVSILRRQVGKELR